MTASPASQASLVVVRLSDSFAEFWPVLAQDVGVALASWEPDPAGGAPFPVGGAVVIVAAGGREADLAGAIAALPRPPGVPLLA
ncbi:MAG: hypothetical protein ACREMN_01615, partial [Gemmatimonadales bacterium]